MNDRHRWSLSPRLHLFLRRPFAEVDELGINQAQLLPKFGTMPEQVRNEALAVLNHLHQRAHVELLIASGHVPTQCPSLDFTTFGGKFAVAFAVILY